jgi:hypothetical protein
VAGAGALQPVVSVRPTCTGSDRACASAVAGGTANLATGSLPAGTWTLWIDGANGSKGAWTLSASLTPPAPGDTCANLAALAFSGGADGGTATASGDTTGLFNDVALGCGGANGNDQNFTFTTARVLDLRATVTGSGPLQPVVALRATCSGADRTCASAPAGGSANLVAGSLPAGTWTLWVDGANGTNGPWSLSASLAPPAAGDTCASGPIPVPLSGTPPSGSVMGTTTGLFGDSTSGCVGTSAPDAVHTFTLAATANVTIAAASTSAGYQPVVSLRTTCAGSELACGVAGTGGGTATLTRNALPAGTYSVWVDGVNGTSGDYTLTVTAN